MSRSCMFFCLLAVLLTGCQKSSKDSVNERKPEEQTSVFSSNNKVLEQTFDWARKMALSYAHDGSDLVGYWYEAALPQREAFCMRDVSHQSVGAQILGLDRHNKNMMMRFAENISESKDWCTYWEINRYNKPAPADYESDEAFWYNLNANFDVMQACLKLYDWTADMDYLTNTCLNNFYERSAKEYVESWMLEPDKIMDRPRFINKPDNFDLKKNFHTCRGLASYVENFRGLTVGVDLLATLYAGYQAYGEMENYLGNSESADCYLKTANEYRTLLEDKWWNPEVNSYNTFWTEDDEFHRGEGVPFILWFNATENTERIRLAVKDILSQEWNVENISAFPAMFYRFGFRQEALKYLLELPHMNRSEYPEVSYGVVEGFIGGMMGIVPSARKSEIATLSQVPDSLTQVSVKNVPVFDGYISVEHNGFTETKLTNNTGRELTWKASFLGDYPLVQAGDKQLETQKNQCVDGSVLSVVEVRLSNGKELCLKALH